MAETSEGCGFLDAVAIPFDRGQAGRRPDSVPAFLASVNEPPISRREHGLHGKMRQAIWGIGVFFVRPVGTDFVLRCCCGMVVAQDIWREVHKSAVTELPLPITTLEESPARCGCHPQKKPFREDYPREGPPQRRPSQETMRGDYQRTRSAARCRCHSIRIGDGGKYDAQKPLHN